MSQDLKSIIDGYKSDEETVYNSWFVNNDERLKAFRTIRRGVFDVIQDIKNGSFGNDFKGSSLEFVLNCITEQKQVFKGASHPFYWKPKLRIPDIYENENNPYDMKLLTQISEHFHEIRPDYETYEGSMKGVDINMLINQVPGGMLSILEKQLLDLNRSDKLKELIQEIPRIREDVGYVPLVTPSSQIVGAQALMNVLDEKRYKTLTKEFVDLVNGEYGKVPGKISIKLLKRVENSKQSELSNDDLKDTKFYKNKFKNFCNENYLKDLHNDNSHLLNYILFTKESENFYLSNMKNNMNDIIGLQEGFGLYINE